MIGGVQFGTTSACAENTERRGGHHPTSGNYLRVRGEYLDMQARGSCPGELPPRARRILEAQAHIAESEGTTSACAENTWTVASLLVLPWNYLRVRGEYTRRPKLNGKNKELPPRARRIRRNPLNPTPTGGTTSACAENTRRRSRHSPYSWNYLRVRGEYALVGGNSCPQ